MTRIYTGVRYLLNVTPNNKEKSEITETFHQTSDKVEKQDSDEAEVQANDYRQEEINHEHWENAPRQNNGQFGLKTNTVKGTAKTVPAPDSMGFFDDAKKSPLMEKRIAIHQLKIHSVNIEIMEGFLNKKETLKKQIFFGYPLERVHTLHIALPKQVLTPDHCEELGRILRHECRNVEVFSLNINLNSADKGLPYKPIANVKKIFDGFSFLNKAREISLNFENTKNIYDDDKLFEYLGKRLAKSENHHLQKLTLSMEYSSITDKEMGNLLAELSRLKNINELTLNMRDNGELTQEGFDDLAGSLKKMDRLKSLRLAIDHDIDIDKLAAALPLTNVAKFTPSHK